MVPCQVMRVHGSAVKFAPPQQIVPGLGRGNLADEQVHRHLMSGLLVATADLSDTSIVETTTPPMQMAAERPESDFGVLGPPLVYGPSAQGAKSPPERQLPAFQRRRHCIQDAQPFDALAGVDGRRATS